MKASAEQMAWVNQIEGPFEYVDLFAKYTEIVGLRIKEVNFGDNVNIWFTDGSFIQIRDDGQSCCENRYTTCDDDLSGHEGGSLLSIELDAAGTWTDPNAKKEGDAEDYEWGGGDCHETQFVKVQTTKGSFTLCTHNEHNGYYGGFSLTVERIR